MLEAFLKLTREMSGNFPKSVHIRQAPLTCFQVFTMIRFLKFSDFFGILGFDKWSGRQDSNLRPSAPKADALPDCATPRFSFEFEQTVMGKGPSNVNLCREGF